MVRTGWAPRSLRLRPRLVEDEAPATRPPPLSHTVGHSVKGVGRAGERRGDILPPFLVVDCPGETFLVITPSSV